MRYSCLLGDKYKYTANASNKDHKITKTHHFAVWYYNLNVAFNIRMLQYSKVRSNVEHSFMHYYVHMNK